MSFTLRTCAIMALWPTLAALAVFALAYLMRGNEWSSGWQLRAVYVTVLFYLGVFSLMLFATRRRSKGEGGEW
jgi:hypothetical protein